MKKFLVITISLITLTACWSNSPATLESVVPVVSNIAGYTGLQDETFEFNLAPTNSRKAASRFTVKNQTSSLQAQADYIDIPVLKARVIAVKKSRVLGVGSVSTSTELTTIFDWSSDTPLTGSVTLSGFHPPEYAGASVSSSTSQTGLITTTKTNQRASGFTGNAFRYKIPGKFNCVDATWNLASGPFVYRQDQPLRLCEQPVKTDHCVTLAGPRAPKVGFVTEYQVISSQLIQSASGVNPVVRFFLPEHAVFQNMDWTSTGDSFGIQCNPEIPTARAIRCTGSWADRATYTLRVRHTSALAETFRVELSSDTPERNPADNTTSLTVAPIIENTSTDLQVIGNVLTSSSVFVEDGLEQLVTVKNLGPGMAVDAFVIAYQSGFAFGSILPSLPSVPGGCVFEGSYQIKCPLPPLAVGEEFTLTVPLQAQVITTTGNTLTGYVEYGFDTNSNNNFLTNPNPVIVSRDPFKEHALEVSLNAPGSVIAGQTHTSSVTVTNHGPNTATSRSLIFVPSFLIPTAAPAGCTLDTSSDEVVCDLTGMAANTSRTFVFSGTASYQQWASSEVEAYFTSSGNDSDAYPQGQNQYVSVERDPNTLHSLELAVTGVPAEYFVNDPVNASITVTNHGPSSSPARDVILQKNLLNLTVPAGCNNQGSSITCSIPSLPLGSTWTRALTGTASTYGQNGYLNISLSGHDLETSAHTGSFYKTFAVHGFVGTLSAGFTPAPPASFDIGNAQTFTVIITNSGQYTSVNDALNIQIDRPNGAVLGAVTSSVQNDCAGPPFPTGNINQFCGLGPIAPGSSYSFSFTVSTSTIGRLRLQASLIGSGNEYTGNIAYHEINTTNGVPLVLAWKPGNGLPSSPPGFVLGQSHPFAVDVTNPNTTSKSFSLEVKIVGSSYLFNLGAPSSCSVITNPVIFDPGDAVDRIATCPMTLGAGQTSSVFFSANFAACNDDPPQSGTNCRSTVEISQVKANLIGATATPLTKNVKVNQ
jgi:hypothetical protein